MKAVVLGGGVIGTATAWFLLKQGHEVVVIDRRPRPGTETSFANGGQISVSHAEPWANPAAPLKILRWLGREDAPLLFRLRADLGQWRWCLGFLRECSPARTRRNIAQIVKLGLFSRSTLQELRRETGILYDQLEKGILHFYTSEKEFAAARKPAAVMREHGCDVTLVDADEVCRIEPALRPVRARIVGGSMTPSDESGDARAFTAALAERAVAAGARYLSATEILAVEHESGRVSGLQLRRPEGDFDIERGDAYVVCLGSFSPRLLRPLGIRLAIYPVKGYSVTLPVADRARAFTVSLTDDEYKLVFSRLGDRLRIAGTAELNGYDASLNHIRCQAILKRTLELFPDVAAPQSAKFWAGLRPATPSNLPYIGRTAFGNLFLNTGHGTLGWTHACGSGRAIAEIVSGRRPTLDFAFTGV